MGASLLSGYGISLSHAQSQAETPPATAAHPEEVEKLVKEADAYFQRQEFAASYDLYLRVLGLAPSHQPARDKIYAIINTYKTLEEAAQKTGNNDQARLYAQKYQNMIRDLLKMLTAQLKREIQRYGELIDAQKKGENVKKGIIPVLSNVIQILQNLKIIYEEFPQGDAGTETEKVVERIGQTIKKYAQELAYYQK